MASLKRDIEEVIEKNKTFLIDNSSYLGNCLTYYKQYRAQPAKLREEIRSSPSVPEMFSEIEALATAFHELIFSENTDAGFFDVLEHRDIYLDLARNAQSLLTAQLEMIQFSRKFLGQCRWTPLYGTSFARIPWLLKEKEITERRGMGFARNKIIEFDSFDYQIISPFHMRYSPSSIDIQDGWVAVEYPVSHEDARYLEKRGFFKNVEQAISRGDSSTEWGYDEQKRRIAGEGVRAKKKTFNIIEYYGLLESRDSISDHRFYLTPNGVVLREPELNPYPHGQKPFLKNVYIDLVDEFRGIGIGEIASRGQDEINERRALSLDLVMAFVYNMWEKLRGAGIEDDDLAYSPNRIVETDIKGAMTPLRPPLDGLPTVMRMEDVTKDDMRRASAAQATLQAIPIDTSVGQFKSIQAEAVRRIKTYAIANYANHLKDFLNMGHGMNAELLETPIMSEIIGEEGVAEFKDFTRRNIPKRIRLKMKISLDSGSRIHRLRNFNEFLFAVAQLVKADPSLRLNYRKLFKLVGKLYDFDSEAMLQEVEIGAAMSNPLMRNQIVDKANEEFVQEGRDILKERGMGTSNGNRSLIER